MAGIYIHIPFCRSKCYYCDFFSKVIRSTEVQSAYVKALCKEIEQRKDYLNTNKIETIYLGGGTPSIFSVDLLVEIFETISKLYELSPNAEITIEVNPDDATFTFFENLKKHTPINRISLGIQSFVDSELKAVNRRHTAQQNIQAIDSALKYGYNNISIDLIYGLLGQTITSWQYSLEMALRFPVKHISAYSLTIEDNTVLGHWLKNKKIIPTDDELLTQMYDILRQATTEAGFIHYEISNFCMPEYHSRHNSSYWQGISYLGIGAGAHSYNGNSRQWNVESIQEYIDGILSDLTIFQIETLDQIDLFNEYILTRLRTMWGIDSAEMSQKFNLLWKEVLPLINKFVAEGLLAKHDTRLVLTESGKLLCDSIIRQLFKLKYND